MGSKPIFPLVITGMNGQPKTLRCHCGSLAVEVREDEFGPYPLCSEHLEQDNMLAAAERGASREVA